MRPTGYKLSGKEDELLTFPNGPVKLRGIDVHLRIVHHYRVVKTSDPKRGPYKVSTVGYDYAFEDLSRKEILAYHWHPNQRSDTVTPHLHLEQAAKVGRKELAQAHLPTGRISIEEMIHVAVRGFGAQHLKRDWQKILAASHQAWEDWRTWPSAKIWNSLDTQDAD